MDREPADPASWIAARRMQAQLLVDRLPRTPVEVTSHLLAVQAQDPRGLRLAVRSRSSDATACDVDRALTEDRSMVITWLHRGTLHLVCSDDYPWLHALTSPLILTSNARRLAQEGVSPDDAERGVAAIDHTLTTHGPSTRAQLRETIASAGVRTEGQALVHVLALAGLRGLLVRGPMSGAEQAYVSPHDWLGGSATATRFDRDAALAELARRYLVAHGPATDRDLARWVGLPLRDVRHGLRAISPTLVELGDGLVDLAAQHDPDRRDTDSRDTDSREPNVRRGGRDADQRDADGRGLRLPPPRLLGSFDPLLLGWVSREFVLGEHRSIVTTNGLFRPFALVEGRAVATWSYAGSEVTLKPFDELPEGVLAALDADAADVRRFFGPDRESPGRDPEELDADRPGRAPGDRPVQL